ncbi:hypothetical protein [Microbulbifer rhizosphaerae]|uniref:Uncharacterized protein n=1 Tax=Microbulbifer rhizosphaerae TaxID=1562603 RepID=A0A7W4WBG1_9GAMM|nr:hypothetical protein [Microbulbifer rhizosphaerae]MBB3060608.1 hypothetical protein [Microbulbifer rhizosphaerae]
MPIAANGRSYREGVVISGFNNDSGTSEQAGSMHCEPNNAYPPIQTLKPAVENVWFIDGPVIRFGMLWPKMPFSTPVTVGRLTDGLFIQTPLPPELKAAEAGHPPK